MHRITVAHKVQSTPAFPSPPGRRNLVGLYIWVIRAMKRKDLCLYVFASPGVGVLSAPWKLTTPERSAPLRASSRTVVPPKQ